MPNKLGFDISFWQDNNATPQGVDFEKAKVNGMEFVFIKASQRNWRDSDFLYNWQHAKAAGLFRGAYHFYDWSLPAKDQAEFFVSLLRSDPGELPPVLDFESRVNVPTRAIAAKAAKEFLDIVERAFGRKPILYTSPGYWREFGTSDSYWRHYPLWVAHYTDGQPIIPAPWTKAAFWQYSSHGDGRKYGAESLNLDMNWFMGDDAEFAALVGQPVPDDGKEEPKMSYKNFAMGRFVTDETWANAAHPFILAHACKSWNYTNPRLRAIQDRCEALKVAFIPVIDHSPDFWTRGQYPLDGPWPVLDKTTPYTEAVTMLAARRYSAVIFRVMDYKNHDGQTENPLWISRTAQFMAEALQKWLNANRPGVKLFIATSWDFTREHFAPNSDAWLTKFPACLTQPASLPLDESFPNPADKPAHTARDTREMWWYTGALIVSPNQTKEQFYQSIGFNPGGVVTPPPGGETTNPPPAGEFVPLATFTAYKAQVDAQFAALQGEIATIKAKAITGTNEERNW